jgi:hypothetical protein
LFNIVYLKGGKKMLKKITLIMSLFMTLALPSQANAFPETDSVKRFSIETGIGLNIFSGFLQAKVSYALPFNNNKFDIYFSHSLNGGIYTPAMQMSSLGGRYYFSDNRGQLPAFSNLPFMSVNVGVLYVHSPMVTDNTVTTVISAGFGDDLRISDNFEVSGAVYAGVPISTQPFLFPFYLRPEINLKFRF